MSGAKILVVDDDLQIRRVMRKMLVAQGYAVSDARSGEEALEMLRRGRHDLVVLDLAMPGMGGLEALRRILAHHPQAQVLTLSAHDDPMHARRALREGALGFLSKRSAPEALLEAVTAIAAGQRYIDKGLAQKMALEEIEGGAKSVTERLSEREFDVFIRLARGATVQRIAEDLNLSPSTVGTHLYNVKQKLRVTNQSELTLIAIREKLIEA